jgi:hypothetical protein
VLEHQTRHDTEPVESQVATGQRKLPAADVSSLRKPLLAVLERAEYEEIRALVEPLLTHADPIHDAVAESKLGHGLLLLLSQVTVRRRARTGASIP